MKLCFQLSCSCLDDLRACRGIIKQFITDVCGGKSSVTEWNPSQSTGKVQKLKVHESSAMKTLVWCLLCLFDQVASFQLSRTALETDDGGNSDIQILAISRLKSHFQLLKRRKALRETSICFRVDHLKQTPPSSVTRSRVHRLHKCRRAPSQALDLASASRPEVAA